MGKGSIKKICGSDLVDEVGIIGQVNKGASESRTGFFTHKARLAFQNYDKLLV